MENIRYGRLDATDEEVHRRGQAGQRRPVHPPPAAGLRDRALGAGQQPEPGTAPAAGHRARHPGRSEHPDPGRGDQQRRHAHRGAHPGGAARLMEGRTSFVIAHRLSTIRDADQMLVIDEGRDHRAGHARGAAGAEGVLSPAVYEPVQGQGGLTHRGESSLAPTCSPLAPTCALSRSLAANRGPLRAGRVLPDEPATTPAARRPTGPRLSRR